MESMQLRHGVTTPPPPINASELQAIADKCEDTWDKDETISADTAAIYGLGAGYTPDQAFRAISTNFNRTINVTVTLDGSPIEGVTVTGITTEDGSPCVTNSEGKTSGVTGVDSVTLTTNSGYVDVNEVSQVVNTGGALETSATLAITSKATGKIEIKSSQTIKFAPSRTSVTYFIVGGGASGCACKWSSNGYYISGSGGGYTKTGTVNPNNQAIVVTVGAGGASAVANSERTQPDEHRGSSGGTTTISGNFGTVSANGGVSGNYGHPRYTNAQAYATGGSGGSGGGGAGYLMDSAENLYYKCGNGGSDGSNGFTDMASASFESTSTGGTGQGTTTTFDGVIYGAGGCGCYQDSTGGWNSGTPGNGAGSNIRSNNGKAPDGTIPGAAGGIAYSNGMYATITSGAGATGIAIFKW